MDDLLSEKEQIEQLRSWWSEYGAFIIGGLAVTGSLLFGYHYYQNTRLQQELDASTAYEALILDVASGKLDDAEKVAHEIATAYGKTTYAGQAGLAMARLYMDKNRDQDAADALLAVVDGRADDELKHVARLRLARIYLYQDKSQEAVDLLAGLKVKAFAAAYGEVLGDAYTALGRIPEAQDAYQKVLMDPLSQGTVDQQLVQWKSLDLPEADVREAEADDESDGDESVPVATVGSQENGAEENE